MRKKKKEHVFVVGKIKKSLSSNKKRFLIPFKTIIWIISDILWFAWSIFKKTFAIGVLIGFVFSIMVVSKIREPVENWYDYAKETIANSKASDFETNNASTIYDANGNLLVELNGEGKSSYLDYKDIPADVIHAFVAVEDRTFWDNEGVDLKGIFRVCVNYVKTKGGDVAGASTITQQLVRTKYLTRDVSIPRKVKEIFMSYFMNQKYSKTDIMEFYVNNCYFASGVYGIEAASELYFNKSVDELSLSQVAYLCAIPNSPTYYNPYTDASRAITRRNKILGDMLECQFITEDEYTEAVSEEIVISEKQTTPVNNYLSTFAIHCATETVMQNNGFEFVYSFDSDEAYEQYLDAYSSAYDEAKASLYKDGYKIYTSLNPDIQAKMQEALDNRINDEAVNPETGIYELQSAMTVIDNQTGKIIAVVGGREQEQTKDTYTLNRAYQSYRQPGSTIKPLIVYTPAFMKGYNANSTLKEISVSTVNHSKNVDISKMSGKSVKLGYAVQESLNGCAYYTFNSIGIDYGISFLKEMQFAKIVPDDYYIPTALGGLTYGTNTVEMASAYAALANHGVYRGRTCITSMLNKNGEEIFTPTEKEIYTAAAADGMIDVMKRVIKSGTAKNMKWSSYSSTEASGKTGTTNDLKDGWFCGSTPYYTIAVWVGYDNPKTVSDIYGKYSANFVWEDSMLQLIDGLPEAKFETANSAGSSSVSTNTDVMPGRNDEEVLSPGYTVGNYRNDMAIISQIDGLISEIKGLDRTGSDYYSKLDSYYAECQSLAESIYGTTLRTQKVSELNTLYNRSK